ncbi:MAG: ring-cleaving dioxygenase [Gemmatimonadaceae bacterium]|jgi:glyoxalase family protein|nr:ring-cleaving dioxygenase [Gemmatimonadaceae bacterium]
MSAPLATAGLHHVTAIAGEPQRNVDFYVGLLGLRLVKRTVNFDDPGTWHLYYGDASGRPGSLLTFFPWPRARRGRPGLGQVAVTQLAIPTGALGFWLARLATAGVRFEGPVTRFDGERVVAFPDPDGMLLELVATDAAAALPGWGGTVDEGVSIRGLHAATLWVGEAEPTVRVLVDRLGHREIARHERTIRLASGDGAPGTLVDVRAIPGFLPGMGGAGTVHHVAFRAGTDPEAYALRDAVIDAGLGITEQRDRHYFRSFYFREPGHVLFELATDAPGFAVDEPLATLGETLRLPPHFEPMRAQLEATLPVFHLPTSAPPGTGDASSVL